MSLYVGHPEQVILPRMSLTGLGKLWFNRQELGARDFVLRQDLENGGILYVPARGMPHP